MPRNFNQFDVNVPRAAVGGHAQPDQIITIRQLNDIANENLAANIVAAVTAAKTRLATCITRCINYKQNTIVAAEFEHFFGMPLKGNKDLLHTILRDLEAVHHGLSTTGFLKVGSPLVQGRPEAIGNVSTFTPHDPGPLQGRSPASEYFERTSMETNDLEATRSIKLHEMLFTGNQVNILAVVTLIHEASHKFMGTVDRFYLELGGAIPDEFDSEDALMNADSYAWFANNVGSYG